MSSPIVKAQKELAQARKENARLQAQLDKGLITALATEQQLKAENTALRVYIARLHTRNSMVLDLFDQTLKNAGTVKEARDWWSNLTKSAMQIDLEADDAEQQMSELYRQTGITWNKEGVINTQKQQLREWV